MESKINSPLIISMLLLFSIVFSDYVFADCFSCGSDCSRNSGCTNHIVATGSCSPSPHCDGSNTIENITLCSSGLNVNGNELVVQAGSVVTVQIDYECYLGYASDRLALWYKDPSENWRHIQSWSETGGGDQSLSCDTDDSPPDGSVISEFNVGSTHGIHYIRAVEMATNNTINENPCPEMNSSWGDVDELAFTVGSGTNSACPDGSCNGNETCHTCPEDCGECINTYNDSLICQSAVFCSGFEESNVDTWDDYDSNPPETTLIILDPGPFNIQGNQVLRLRAPAGESGYGDLVKALPSSHDKLYARWYQKWENGYNFEAANHGSGFHAGPRNYLGRSGRKPPYNGIWWFSMWLEPSAGSSLPGVLNLYTYYPGMYMDNPYGDHFPCMLDEGQAYCTNADHRETVVPPKLETGRWYCLEIMLDGGTPTPTGTNANGVKNFWIDGVEYGPWPNQWHRNSYDTKINHLSLSLYHHDGSHSIEGIMIDNVVVSTERIGFSRAQPPPAPDNLSVTQQD